MSQFYIIGESPTRMDALDKVTGKAKFTADYHMPGMLHLKVVKNPHPHAAILNIDTSSAERLYGVRGIITAEDVPRSRTGTLLLDRYILPRDGIVRFVGEPVLMVAADTPDIAEEAADLVQVEYAPLPAVFDVEQAMREDTPAIIHPDRADYTYEPHPRYGEFRVPGMSNLQNSAFTRVGDAASAFAHADLIVENRFQADSVQHSPLETHIITAWTEPDGTLAIRTSQQGYFSLRQHLSKFLGLPMSKVRVFGPYLGGAFGSKLSRFPTAMAAIAAMKLRRPVQLEYTREEDLTTGGRNSGIIIMLKHGVRKDGTLLALEAKLLIDGGAYGADLMGVIPRTALNALGVIYRIPNVRADAYAIYTNHPQACTLRGVEAPHVTWALEQQMDIIAEKLGMDPIAFRMKNILNEGEENPVGEITQSISVRECLDKVSQWIGWGKKAEEPAAGWVSGKGIGVGPCLVGLGYTATSRIKVSMDGTVEIYCGSSEMGQGAHTMVAQVAAEEFRIPMSKTRVIYGDTDITPWDFDNQASRTTLSTGNAVMRACRDARRQIFELAAPRMGLGPADLDIADGRIFCKDFPSISIPLSDLFTPAGFVKGIGEILGRGEYTATAPPMDKETGRFKRLAIWSFAAYAAEVAVNLETGAIKLTRLAGAIDVGQPINTRMCEQQIEGGMGMGVGFTLLEQLVYDQGKLVNPDLVNYRLPTTMDIPSGDNYASLLVKCPHKDGPYGAKGFGEAPLVAVSGAIANALRNATGKRLYQLPLTRDRVLSAIMSSGE